MRTNSKVSAGSDSADERDLELENIVGNLMVAEYQVDRLRQKLVERVSPAYSSGQAKDRSAYSFKVGAKWYRISVMVEEDQIVGREQE